MKRHWVKEYDTTKGHRYNLSTTYCGKELNFMINEEAQTEAEINCKGCLNSLEKEKSK